MGGARRARARRGARSSRCVVEGTFLPVLCTTLAIFLAQQVPFLSILSGSLLSRMCREKECVCKRANCWTKALQSAYYGCEGGTRSERTIGIELK